MPYKNDKQRKFIHAAAKRGQKWAQKFVKDAEGKEKEPKVSKRRRMKRAAKKQRR